MPEDLGCPCGGTHVHAVEEIGKVVIDKIKKKKTNTQVSYKVLSQYNHSDPEGGTTNGTTLIKF